MHRVEMLRPGGGTAAVERKPAPDLKRALHRLAGQLPAAGAFFLFSLVQCFSLPSPYAVCCLMALLSADRHAYGPAIGLAAGLAFRLFWRLPLDIWQFAACFLAYGMIRLPWTSRRQFCLLTDMLLIFRTVPDALRSPDLQTALLASAGMLLGMVSVPALYRAARLMKQSKREWSEDDLLCLLLPCLLLIAGASRLSAFRVNIGYTVSVLTVLLLSWTMGGAVGICGGLGCGLALLIGGQSALLLVILTFGALVAGLFQGKARLLPLSCFLLSAVTLTYLIAFSFQPQLFQAEACAGLAFLLLPVSWTRRLTAWARAMGWRAPRENAYTRMKMQKWVRAIDRMAEALPMPQTDMPSQEEENEYLAETLCAGCDRMPICWHEQLEQTREGMRALTDRNDDAEDYLNVINQYFSACPRISRLPSLLGRMEEGRQEKKHRTLCAAYERDMLQTHLTALSQAAQRISMEGMNRDAEESYWVSQADEALQALRFPGKTVFAKKVDGHLAVCLKCETLSLRPAAGDGLIRQLSVYLNVPLEITENKSGRILLEEQPPLCVQTGIATACAVNPERRRKAGGSPDNGDAVLIQPLSGGKMMLALSDGMGHGAGAQDESRKTLELLSLCMEAGYTRTQAATAVNGAMLSATGGEKFATVDLCLLDLWNGEAAMNKLGACASVVMQGQKIQWIQGEALPLGIIEHVVPMEHRVTLAEGDLLLMMSDGITDAFASENEMMEIVRKGRMQTPQTLADSLLREAVMRKDGLPPDDMTVLCARIKERKHAQSGAI